MSKTMKHSGGAGPSHRMMEIAVASVMGLFGLIAVIGALRVGRGWGAEGPQAGFFPFYVGSIVVIASAVNIWHVLRSEVDGKPFSEWSQLQQVAAVVVPTAVYVAIIPHLGIYVSSAFLIGAFMMWFGRYAWHLSIAIAVAVPIGIYFMFEKWFLVPLPKGPLERLLSLTV